MAPRVMLATIHTSDGPQLTLDVFEAVKTILALPLGDYAIEFHHPPEEITFMNTPILPPPPPSSSENEPPRRLTLDETMRLRRLTGSGGFTSIESICGIVDPRRPRKALWHRRNGLHPGQ